MASADQSRAEHNQRTQEQPLGHDKNGNEVNLKGLDRNPFEDNEKGRRRAQHAAESWREDL